MLIRDYFTPQALETLKTYREKLQEWKESKPTELTDLEKLELVDYFKEYNTIHPAYEGKYDIMVDREEGGNGVDYEVIDYALEEWRTKKFDEITPYPEVMRLLYYMELEKRGLTPEEYEEHRQKVRTPQNEEEARSWRELETIYKENYEKLEISTIDIKRVMFHAWVKTLSEERQKEIYDEIVTPVIAPEDESEYEALIKALDGLFEISETALVMYKENTPLFSVTREEYRGAFLPTKNDHAYILDQGQMTVEFDENGEFKDFSTVKQKEDLEKKRKSLEDAPSDVIDEVLYAIIASAVIASLPKITGHEIQVYAPLFFNALGKQFRKSDFKENNTAQDRKTRHADVWSELNKLEGKTGYLDGKYYSVYKFESYDPKTNILSFIAPYVVELIKTMKERPKIVGEGSKAHPEPYYNTLINSDISKEKNKVGVQLVLDIVPRIVKRGTITDYDLESSDYKKKKIEDHKLVSYKVTYKTLIERTPRLKEAFDGASAKNKLVILNRALKSFEKYMKEDTQCYGKYIDFKVTITPPSMKSLDKDGVEISHHGENLKFKNPNELPDVEILEEGSKK